MAQLHPLSKKLSEDALDRFSSTGDPYGVLVTDTNFRSALLKSLDGTMIISGAVLEEVQKLNGGGNGRWHRVKRQGPGVLGGAGFAAVFLKLVDVLV